MNKKIAQLGLFTALILMLGLTPLGFLHLPLASITMTHIPVIVGAIMFGPKAGAYFGGVFGLSSFLRALATPDMLSMIIFGTNSGENFGIYNLFLIVAIMFVPRILVGLFSGLIFKAFKGKFESFAIGLSAFCGSMTNTILFLGGFYVFAFDEASKGFGVTDGSPITFFNVLLGIVSFNGLLEAMVAVIICIAICKVLLKYTKRKN